MLNYSSLKKKRVSWKLGITYCENSIAKKSTSLISCTTKKYNYSDAKKSDRLIILNFIWI